MLFFSEMISLDHLLIDETVLSARFACDVHRCKGACCTLPGGAGAPVLDKEVELIQSAQPAAEKYLSEASKKVLHEKGPLEGHAGDWTTVCIDDKDCVFVAYEQNVAVCTLEKAWHAGESTFRKPLSCHLFPIRIADFGGPYIFYEQFEECKPGRQRGERSNVKLIETVREALIRAVGEDMYNRIVQLSLKRRQEKTQ